MLLLDQVVGLGLGKYNRLKLDPSIVVDLHGFNFDVYWDDQVI